MGSVLTILQALLGGKRGVMSWSGWQATVAGAGGTAAAMPMLGQLPLLAGCGCFSRSNYFVAEALGSPLNRHFVFDDRDQFERDYKDTIPSRLLDDVVAQCEQEQRRRLNADAMSKFRRESIAELYKPLHGDALLYKTDARFHDVVVAASPPPLEDGMVTTEHRISQLLRCDGLQEHVPGNIYTLPLLTPEQCALIHQELAHFATQAPAILKGRVNSMNRNGLLLDEVGFTESLVNKLVRDLRPVCGLLFGPEFETLDHHRAFTVWYGPGRDTKLAKHFDNAEVTINVNLHLSEDAKGGEVDFFGPRHSRVASCTPRFRFRQAVGQAVLHLGSEMHCALPQAKGERHNLVIWMRSSTYRTDHGCPMCGGPWHLEQSTTTGRSR
eukprot:m.272139 g.272139  ORF g.272139 m.272139 type:complete len:383 (+) comp19329_c0_seq14:913-2061(+)